TLLGPWSQSTFRISSSRPVGVGIGSTGRPPMTEGVKPNSLGIRRGQGPKVKGYRSAHGKNVQGAFGRRAKAVGWAESARPTREAAWASPTRPTLRPTDHGSRVRRARKRPEASLLAMPAERPPVIEEGSGGPYVSAFRRGKQRPAAESRSQGHGDPGRAL